MNSSENATRDWYYIKGGKQHGPISEDELITNFRSGGLSLSTLVRTKELKDWTIARDIENLLPDDLIQSLRPSVYPESRPWMRYFAKQIDISLAGLFLGILGALIYPDFVKLHGGIFSLFLLFAYIFIEPIMLCSWGSTPGRSLLGIRLRRNDGNKLTFSEALRRAFDVWVSGFGLGIPFIYLYTTITSYIRLKDEGITVWDKNGGFCVTHTPIGFLRGTLAVIVIIVLFVTTKK